MEYKTWDEFWAKFLQVTFHLQNPERWPSRERRAQWCLSHLRVDRGAKILNIGCGDGVLDICLSRLGMEVTAVDRNPSVLSHAKSEDDTKRVNFVVSDLRKLQLPTGNFQVALFLESSGLVNKEQDLHLIRNIYDWLSPGGKLIIDCPLSEETSGSWKKTFPEGELTFNHTFDSKTRMFRIEPSFKDTSGHVFGLMDPIRDSLSGLSRYYYPKDEISSMLKSVGFSISDVEPHYYGEKYFALLAVK